MAQRGDGAAGAHGNRRAVRVRHQLDHRPPGRRQAPGALPPSRACLPGEAPVIQLKVGGFNHRDDRIGWVSTPVLAHVSRVARADAVAPPAAALAAPRAEFDDSVPF